MKERLENRLQRLHEEFATGQTQLAEIEKQRMELDARTKHIQETLLRISGAVLVLEEELRAENDNGAPATEHAVAADA